MCGIHTPIRPCQFPHCLRHTASASGGRAMTFEEILDQAIAMLQRRGRLTYSTLKRQFQLDDAALEDLKNELIEGQRLACDKQGNVLVWTGGSDLPQLRPSRGLFSNRTKNNVSGSSAFRYTSSSSRLSGHSILRLSSSSMGDAYVPKTCEMVRWHSLDRRCFLS